MSDDVITLDSSDEESKPANQKPKIKTPTKPPAVKNLSRPRSGPAVSISVKTPTSLLNPTSTSFLKIKGPSPNPFNTQIRKTLSQNKVRPVHIKQNAVFQPKNFTPLPIANSFGPVQPFFQGMQFNNTNYLNAPLRVTSNVRGRVQTPKMQRKSINPINMPIIVNTKTLSNAQKKTNSQNFISALPAGITVTRTSSKSTLKKTPTFPSDIVVKRNSRVVNPLTILPPEITTVELDDDDDDDNIPVDKKIPIEYDATDEKKKNTSVDVKEDEKASITTDILPEVGSPNVSLETNNKHNSEIVDNITNISEEPVSEDVDSSKTFISYHTPKKNDSKKVLAKDNRAVKNVIIDVIELTDSPVKCSDDTASKEKERNDIISDDVKSVNIEKIVDQPESSPKHSPIERSVSPDTIDPATIKKVEISIVMKPDDVIMVEEHIKNTPKKNEPNLSGDGEREINETYQKFINLCFKLDKSEDMEKIIRKRVKGYYLLVHPSYTESKSFCKYVEGKISEITSNPGSLFLYIKDVVDELKVRRMKTKRSSEEHKSPERSKQDSVIEQEEKEEDDEEEKEEEDEEDRVINSRIHKLERAMRKLSKAIEKLEEREIDYDDEENSAYLLADRYKNRLMRIYRKLCTLTGERDEARRSASVRGLSRLALCGGRLPRLAAAVRAAAKSRPHWFPDYLDVYKCVEHCAKEQDLTLRPDELQREAREAFVEIGTLLQQRRREQEYEELSWRLGSNSDPAETDQELAAALLKNRELSKHREMEVINKFAEKQSNLKLVAEIVQDADVDKSEDSSEESDDDSASQIEENSNPLKNDMTNEDNNVGESSKISDGEDVKREDETKVDDKYKKDLEEASCSDKLTEICDYLKLEKQPHKATEEVSRKRKVIDDYNNGSDNSVSSLSFIELSSSDSQESTKSEKYKKRKCNENFKRLKSIRPNSAMSGVNVIEESSSHSCNKFENVSLSKTSSDVMMIVEESNEGTGKQCVILESESPRDEDDNAMDGTLHKGDIGSVDNQEPTIEDIDDGRIEVCIDITDKEVDSVCTVNSENNELHDEVPNDRITEPNIINSDRETHETYPTDENDLLKEICVKSSDERPTSHHSISNKHKTDAEQVIVTLCDESCEAEKSDKQTCQDDEYIETERSYSDEKSLLRAICEKDVNDQPMDTDCSDGNGYNCNQSKLVVENKNNDEKLCQGSMNGGRPDDDDVEIIQEFYEDQIDIVEHDITSLCVENHVLEKS